jgi:long-subunit acyl-CoA synthetase (AMP-forming)
MIPMAGHPGRAGPAIAGVEMKIAENEEIVVRGPNIFPGYWNRPEETAKVLRDGWFHTGDQGEVDANGNWKIVGRIKNLIILGSGHNIAPEPIEDKILQQLPDASQVVLVGNGRGYLAALITGKVSGREGAGCAGPGESGNFRITSRCGRFIWWKSIHHRKRVADGERKAEARLDCRALSKEIDAMYEAMYRKNQAAKTA